MSSRCAVCVSFMFLVVWLLGPVPRTFIGPIILNIGTFASWIIWYCVQFIPYLRDWLFFYNFQITQQYCVRFVLLTINVICLSLFRRFWLKSYIIYNINCYKFGNMTNVNNKHNKMMASINRNGKKTKTSQVNLHLLNAMKRRTVCGFTSVFTMLIICQFHYLFYISRLLPNIFALAIVTLSFAQYFASNFDRCLQLLAISTIVFRSDTLVIAVPMIVIMCYKAYSICSVAYLSKLMQKKHKNVTKMKHLKQQYSKKNSSSNNNNNNSNNNKQEQSGDKQSQQEDLLQSEQQKVDTHPYKNRIVSFTDDTDIAYNTSDTDFVDARESSHCLEFWIFYFHTFLKWFIVGAVWISIATIVFVCIVDTYFWGKVAKFQEFRLVWPEFLVFHFNAIENRSHEWGVSPFYAYFVTFMPKMLLANMLFACFAVFKLSPMYVEIFAFCFVLYFISVVTFVFGCFL